MPPSTSRAIVEPTTLTRPTVRAPRRLASRIAASVSAVSPRLGDPDDQGAVVHDRIAVAELGRVFDLDRDPRHLLEHVLADQRRVPGRAARGDDDALDLLELVVGQVEAGDA